MPTQDINQLLQSSDADLLAITETVSKIYNGTAPISVDNDNDLISIDPAAVSTKVTGSEHIQVTETTNEQGHKEYQIETIGEFGKTYTGVSPIIVDNDNDTISFDGSIEGKTYTGVSPIVVDNDNNTISIDEIISRGYYVTPEDYGAIGDGTTDDTDAWKEMIADNSDKAKTIILPSNSKYSINFWNFTLQNRTILGANKNSSGIRQRNSNVPFCTMGTNSNLGNFTWVCGNNTSLNSIINFGLNANGTFTPFIGAYVHDILGYCVQNVVAIDFKYASSGSYNVRIERCKFDNPGYGIRVISVESGVVTTTSYLTDFIFQDILVSAPYYYGYAFVKSQAGGKTVSHGSMLNCSVQLNRVNSCGFKLSYCNINIFNPTCFLETGTNSGTGYCLELDYNKSHPKNYVGAGINIYGGLLEGYIRNKEFLNYLIKYYNTSIVEEPNFAYNSRGERICTWHDTTNKTSVLSDTFNNLLMKKTLHNCSGSLADSKFGKALKLLPTSIDSGTFVTLDFDVSNKINDTTISVAAIYKLSNDYTWHDTTSTPFIYLTDGVNTVYSLLGQSIGSEAYGKNTMSVDKEYYVMEDIFDISGLDLSNLTLCFTWPTLYASSTSDYIELLGINVWNNYFCGNVSLNEVKTYIESVVNIEKIIASVTLNSGNFMCTYPSITCNENTLVNYSIENLELSSNSAVTVLPYIDNTPDYNNVVNTAGLQSTYNYISGNLIIPAGTHTLKLEIASTSLVTTSVPYSSANIIRI